MNIQTEKPTWFRDASRLETVRIESSIDNSLRDLPDEMSAASVIQAQRNKQASNITVKAQPKLVQLMGGGVFSDFEWVPDDYDNCREVLIY